MDKEELEKLISEGKTVSDIARDNKTYPNKIRRLLKKFGIKPPDRSEAAKLALENGARKHPTKGRRRTVKEKNRISNGISDYRHKHPITEEHKAILTSRWNKLTDEEKKETIRNMHRGLQKSAQVGSKVERYISGELQSRKILVESHKSSVLADQALELDIFLPEYNLVVEVDGPTHTQPIFGEEALEKTRKADALKNALVLSLGFKMIRVQFHSRRISLRLQKEAVYAIIDHVIKIKEGEQVEDLVVLQIGVNSAN